MQYKKILSVGLSLIMALSAAGCGAATGASTAAGEAAEEAAQPAAAQETQDAAAAGEAAPEETAQEAAGTDAAAQAAAGSEEIPQSDVSVKWDDSLLYPGTSLGNPVTLTTYEVKGYEDVPFIKASDYLKFLFEGKEKVSMENGVMIVSINGTTATIDPAADTIEMENPNKLRDFDVISGAVVVRPEYNVITPSVKTRSTETETSPLVISLKDYQMPAVAYEDDVLLPFLALQNTFGNICMNVCLAYNGKDYYNIASAANYMLTHMNTAKESPYMKAIFSGPFSEKDKTTQAYADYGYYSICLLLDLTFGHKEERNITTFDEYFTRMNAKEMMCSTNPSAAVTAEFLLFNYLFDSGHDSMMSFDTVFGKVQVDESTVNGIADEIKESDAGSELFNEEQKEEDTEELLNTILGALLEKGFRIPEVAPLYIWTSFMSRAKPADYGEQRLDYVGDTAVIFFTHFMDDIERDPSFYLDPVNKDDEAKSNFAFFYNCFEDIRQHDEVKNVVINLSDNGGGAASGLISILGFLSEDGEVNFTDKDMLTGSYREERYHVDTNLDGVADDQDGFGGQYNFYIMCSGSSYSCGNALPYFAQKDGLAKVIGTMPGGGDCVVGTFVDAYGRCAGFSSMLKLGEETEGGFVSDEKATVLDYNMMPSIVDITLVPWFDAEGIAEAVHNCENGETAAVYSEEEEQEAISQLLMKLLERMPKQDTEE